MLWVVRRDNRIQAEKTDAMSNTKHTTAFYADGRRRPGITLHGKQKCSSCGAVLAADRSCPRDECVRSVAGVGRERARVVSARLAKLVPSNHSVHTGIDFGVEVAALRVFVGKVLDEDFARAEALPWVDRWPTPIWRVGEITDRIPQYASRAEKLGMLHAMFEGRPVGVPISADDVVHALSLCVADGLPITATEPRAGIFMVTSDERFGSYFIDLAARVEGLDHLLDCAAWITVTELFKVVRITHESIRQALVLFDAPVDAIKSISIGPWHQVVDQQGREMSLSNTFWYGNKFELSQCARWLREGSK